jgi:hypothetical protein
LGRLEFVCEREQITVPVNIMSARLDGVGNPSLGLLTSQQTRSGPTKECRWSIFLSKTTPAR